MPKAAMGRPALTKDVCDPHLATEERGNRQERDRVPERTGSGSDYVVPGEGGVHNDRREEYARTLSPIRPRRDALYRMGEAPGPRG
jgi:hypothetical protein